MKKVESQNLIKKINIILNEWDFIGVADAVDDEYDCFVEPLATLLTAKSSRSDVKNYIEKELKEHFGMENIYNKESLEKTLDKLMALEIS